MGARVGDETFRAMILSPERRDGFVKLQMGGNCQF